MSNQERPTPENERSASRQGDASKLKLLHEKNTEELPVGKPLDLRSFGVESLKDYYHAPSERFLVRNSAGRWLTHSCSSYKRTLAKRGSSGRTSRGEELSEIDHKILTTQDENDISGFGLLCGCNSGLLNTGGVRFLVTEDIPLIEPAPGEFPTIRAIMEGLLVNGETENIGMDQLHTFQGWLKSSAQALRKGLPQQQQALAICGPADCGKSLIQHHLITPCLANRSADASRYFLKGSEFNADLFEAEHLLLDDAHCSTSLRDRVAFGAKLKSHTVGATTKELHGKGKKALHLQPWWRITITLNDCNESMMVLPPLDENIADKIIMLHASRFEFPEPVDTAEDKEAFAKKIRAEIPAFLHFLLNEYELPDQYGDRRYNVATFHHPALREALEAFSPETELLELIDQVFQGRFRNGSVRMAAAEIESRIVKADKRRAERIFHNARSCATYLGRLARKHPERVKKADTAKERGWRLCPKE